MPESLSPTEIEERVQILRRFREALLRQRERFSQYLRMLEQSGASEETDSEQLEIQVAMEHAVLKEIASFQQVIEPLELMYRQHDPDGVADFPRLKAALERTRDQVVRRTEHHRDLLRAQIDALRHEIEGLRVMRRQRSLFATPEPTTIDISA